jgi:23S rRNA (adenine1618-N6)-methyltransferase
MVTIATASNYNMKRKKKSHPTIKSNLHPRNKHQGRYEFEALIESVPELEQFVKLNKYGDLSIDYFNPSAVRELNRSLLIHFYQIEYWDIPKNYLCPPVPGRADYVHYISDLLESSNSHFEKSNPPENTHVKCLDIGVGANCIYPIIGAVEYGWSIVGSDIDLYAIENAQRIIDSNPQLERKIELRIQKEPDQIFKGVINKKETFDITICNPPFHASKEQASSSSSRKLKNLKGSKSHEQVLNFGGQYNELWCAGGEIQFVLNMIFESKQYSSSCLWFSTLISKESNLKKVYQALELIKAIEVKTIPMQQGNKKSRIIAWSFLHKNQHQKWFQRNRSRLNSQA